MRIDKQKARDILSYKNFGLDLNGLNSVDILGYKRVENNNKNNNFKDSDVDVSKINLEFILEKLNAKKVSFNRYDYANNIISIKDDKFYNVNFSKGGVGPRLLARHLFTLNKYTVETNDSDKIPFIDNDLNQTADTWLDNLASNGVEAKLETDEQRKLRHQALNQDLNNIDLKSLLEMLGATPNEDGQHGKWKLPITGDNVAVTGQKWFSWKTQEGGVGALSFFTYYVAESEGLNYSDDADRRRAWLDARKKLIGMFGIENIEDYAASRDTMDIALKVPYSPPLELSEKNHLVVEYLHKKRDIPLWLIQKSIDSKTLFAGYPSDWEQQPRNSDEIANWPSERVWATFASLSKSSAEMRAVNRDDVYSKLLAVGSDKDFAGFSVKAEKDVDERTILATEAAVDALACAAIYPGKTTVSCMGVTYNLALKMALQSFDNKYSFNLGFDNDSAGLGATVRFADALNTEFVNQIIEGMGDDYTESEELVKKISDQAVSKRRKMMESKELVLFSLALLELKDCLDNNQVFYLDMKAGASGEDVVRYFHWEARCHYGKEYIMEKLADNQIKYLNLEPDYDRVRDIEAEVDRVIESLNSESPYYYTIDGPDPNEKDKKKIQNRQKFLDLFYIKSKPFMKNWEEKNAIVYGSVPKIAKDWNDYLKHKIKTSPDFVKNLRDNENKYGKKNKKIPTP